MTADNTCILALDGHDALAESLARQLIAEGRDCRILACESRHFPDGELYFNLPENVAGADVIVLCHLHQPSDKTLALWFMAHHLKDMGAARVGLVAPYLAYMRQDIRFQPGECLTSRYFADLINQSFDYLITVDPHLHRYKSLDEIYRIPAFALHATDLIGDYLKTQVNNPLVVGPDEESEQWASEVAAVAGCDYLVLRKTRSGDRDVAIHIPDVQKYADHQPVLVDDIISTGRTMLRTAEELVQQGLKEPLCIGVHAVFSAGGEGQKPALQEMQEGPVAGIVTCNCIPHASNAIDISPLITPALFAQLQQPPATLTNA
ncbi:MAG: phosphoribosylpyrophosphate synthetase [Oceanospirillaceae bacterium]|nr:phosphoribosylpyrophosphate synthetase [Oceanospirillaceae bacterium]MBT13061.1 phosphoribosylpyrophosphate synthetase [Oceanospirillaceae bacterium]|tara:strand:+ start:8237 stop:9193 length:957 start_codon:yes stop_codon:yes gene_type:complete